MFLVVYDKDQRLRLGYVNLRILALLVAHKGLSYNELWFHTGLKGHHLKRALRTLLTLDLVVEQGLSYVPTRRGELLIEHLKATLNISNEDIITNPEEVIKEYIQFPPKFRSIYYVPMGSPLKNLKQKMKKFFSKTRYGRVGTV